MDSLFKVRTTPHGIGFEYISSLIFPPTCFTFSLLLISETMCRWPKRGHFCKIYAKSPILGIGTKIAITFRVYFDTTFLIILRLLLRFGKNIWKWVVLYVKKPFAVISCTVLVKKAFTVCQSLFMMVSKFEKAHGYSEIHTDLKTHFHSSLSKYSKDKKTSAYPYVFSRKLSNVHISYFLLRILFLCSRMKICTSLRHGRGKCQPCKK